MVRIESFTSKTIRRREERECDHGWYVWTKLRAEERKLTGAQRERFNKN